MPIDITRVDEFGDRHGHSLLIIGQGGRKAPGLRPWGTTSCISEDDLGNGEDDLGNDDVETAADDRCFEAARAT
ncbi:hypothetical protein ACFC96_08420 [Streptomyces sp. NPDC055955]|uniref:hypothetical protein n=1 Tax=Streptomyces sp. NPDC055955 TaxID=3345665 RepID=UPI0035D64747